MAKKLELGCGENLCSKGHYTKTNFVIVFLEQVKDELRFIIVKGFSPASMSYMEW